MKRWFSIPLTVFLVTLAGGCDLGGPAGTPTATPPPLYRGQLAFASNRSGHYEIWLINSDGTGLEQLTDGGLVERHGPTWSPDGTRIAYYVQTRTAYTAIPEDIMVLRIEAPQTDVVSITHTPLVVDRDPAWSPDGKTIAYCTDFALMLGDADGSNARIIRDDHRYYTSAWSPVLPGGGPLRLAVGVQLSEHDYGVFVMEADGSNLMRITQSTESQFDPAWSPDGTTILFSNNADRQIHAVPAPPPEGFKELPQTRPLTSVGVNTEPAWSPDGTTIAYVHTEGWSRDIWVMYKDGAGARTVTGEDNPEDISPAWRPR